MTDAPAIDLAQTIELSVAPVFLLVALGSFLNVMTQRLGRVVDRARHLEAAVRDEPKGAVRDRTVAELKALGARISYANRAIGLSSAAALCVAIDVAILFLAELIGARLTTLAAGLFIVSMVGLIASLGFFLAEVSVATRTLRSGYLEK
ncbi:MAG: DUF2721 domain-containing protein [Parvularculaceae bacterium]